MANEFRIQHGLIVNGNIQVPNGATVDGVDISAHVGSGGSAHALVVASTGGSGGTAGFISAVDKEKLDGLENYTFPGLSNADAGIITIANASYPYSATLAEESVTNEMLLGEIATSKLTDGSLFLKSDGTVPLTANWNINSGGGTSYRITGVPNPINGSDAVNLDYLTGVVSGFNLKDPVDCATTATETDIDLLNPPATIDGVSLVLNTRVLVKNQDSNPEQNGIYVLNSSGDLVRSSDANDDGSDSDNTNDVTIGLTVFVDGGDTNANSSWAISQANPTPLVLDTSELRFTLFARTGEIIAGDGLVKDGTAINVVGTAGQITTSANSIGIATDYLGQTSITTLSNTTGVTTGVWKATPITVNKGGTNITSYTAGDILYASGTTTLSKLALSAGKVLLSTNTPSPAPYWGSVNLTTHVAGVLPIANGGTNANNAEEAFDNLAPTSATAVPTGSIIYHDGTNNVALEANTVDEKRFLVSQATSGSPGNPSWEQVTTADVSGLSTYVDNKLNAFAGTTNIVNVGVISNVGSAWQGGIITGQYGGTGVANTGKTITIAGNVTLSGGHNLTLNTTAATNVILPTTGTLATLAGEETFTNKTIDYPIIVNGAYFETGSIAFEGVTVTSLVTTLGVEDPTDNRTVTIPDKSGTIALLTNKLSDFATTTSAELAGVISDEAGTGSLVFSDNTTLNSPTLVTPDIGVATATTINGVKIGLDVNTLTIGEPYLTGYGKRGIRIANTYTTDAPVIFNLSSDAVTNVINLGSGGTLSGMAYAPADIELTPDDGDIIYFDSSSGSTGEWVNGTFSALGTINLGGTTNITFNSTGSAVMDYFEVTHPNNALYDIYVPTAQAKVIHCEYFVHDATYTSTRAGKLIVISDGSSVDIIEYNTADIPTTGNTTEYVFSAGTVTGGVKLQATAPAAGWVVKGYIKTLA